MSGVLRTAAETRLAPILSRLGAAATRIRALEGWPRHALAMLAGAASAAAMAPLHVVLVLFVTVPTLVFLIDGAGEGRRGIARAALSGFLFGWGYFLCGLYWIGFAFLVDADTFAWMIPFVALFFPSFLALYWAAAAGLARALWRPGPARILILTALLSAAEWVRGHVFTGFPWNLPGYTWADILPMLQGAALFGIYGLSFVTLLIAGSFAMLADPPGTRGRFFFPAGAIGLLVLLFAGGMLRLAMIVPGKSPNVALRIVQAHVDQKVLNDLDMQPALFAQYRELSMRPGLDAARIVIWPEAAAPLFVNENAAALGAIGSMLQPDKLLVTGGLRRADRPDGTVDVYNSMYAVDSAGKIVANYDKFHLVPFGEYLPLQPLLERLGLMKLTGGLGSFAEGEGLRTLAIPGAPDAGPLICYEIIFPGEVVGQRRPAWLLNITDDSWFGSGAGPLQHFDTSRLRAIEEGLPVVRAANKGIAAIIGPRGEIVAKNPLNTIGVLDGPLPLSLAPTIFSRLRDIPFALMIISTLIVGLGWPRPATPPRSH